MSKIGKKPIVIPKGVEVRQTDGVLEFKNKDAVFPLKMLPFIEVKIDGDNLAFEMKEKTLQAKANWGTMRALAQNVVIGLTSGFQKTLELKGVGFKAAVEGNVLVLNVGFSHPVKFPAPAGIKIVVEKSNIIITGIDKAMVGEVAAKIRSVQKPNPYRGTGIRYKDEVIKMKAGKKAAGATGGAA